MPFSAVDSGEIDEEEAKEWEHTLLQNSMDKELNELNRRLEQKEVHFWSHKCILICKLMGFHEYCLSYNLQNLDFPLNCVHFKSGRITGTFFKLKL